MTFDFAELTGPAWSQLWQVSVMILAVALATRLFCRKRPHLAYVLWLLVIVKCLTPPVWSSPTGVFSWTMARRAATAVVEAPRIDAPNDNMPVEATPVVSSPLKKGAKLRGTGILPVKKTSHGQDGRATGRQAASATLAHRPDLVTTVAILWLAGAATHAGIWIVMRLGWSWRLHRSRVSARPQWTALLESLSRRLGVRRKVRLLVTSQPVGPAVFGLLRPTLVMPEAVLAEGNTSKLKAVLAHELLHIRRGDTIVGLLQLLAQTLWWFHPLVWWANREQGRQRERCCDEEVLAGLDCEPAEYAQSLIDLLKLKRSLRPLIAFPGIRPVEVTSKRLESIMDSTKQFRRRTPRRYWLALAVGILAFVPGAGLTLGDSTRPTDEPAAAKPVVAKPAVAEPTTGGIRPMDLLDIKAINTLPDQPINGTFLVDLDGQVSLGPAYGRFDVKGLSLEEAEGSIEKKLRELLRDPQASVTRAGRIMGWSKAILPEAPYRIKQGDKVHINVANTFVGQPINWDYRVEPSGKVSLGPAYKRVQINGMTLQEAEAAIKKHLQKIIKQPEVAVTMANWKREFTMFSTIPTAPYRIAPGDLLKIEALNTLNDQPINQRFYLIEPSGKVCLGPAYGRVQLKGMSVQEAEAAIKKHLQRILRHPEVSVIRGGWMRTTSREATSDQAEIVRPAPAKDIMKYLRDSPPTTTPKTAGKVVNPDGKRVDMGVVVAKHVLLLDGKKIITWDELEKRIAALPDPSLAYPHFYSTRGAHEAGIYPKAKEKIWHLHKKFKLKGHSEGSLWPRTDFRYDRIKTAKDLVPDESLRVEGHITDSKGEPVADADVLLVTPVDKSIPFKSYHVALVKGRIHNQLDHVMTRSDEKGQFVLYPPKDMKSYVVALHPTAGFTLQRGKDLSDGGKIRLIPWASLESHFDGGAVQQQGASLSTLVREKDGFPEVVFNQDSKSQKGVKKDSPPGMFRFTHVPPIFNTTISRMFPDKQGVSYSSTGATVGLLPGESRRLDLAPMSNKQQEWLEQIREMSRSRGKTK